MASFTYLIMSDYHYYLENIEHLIEVKVLTSYVELMDFLILPCYLFEKIAAKNLPCGVSRPEFTCGLKCTVWISLAGIVLEHLKKIGKFTKVSQLIPLYWI